eukprot:scpid43047/ scgid28768/ 
MRIIHKYTCRYMTDEQCRSTVISIRVHSHRDCTHSLYLASQRTPPADKFKRVDVYARFNSPSLSGNVPCTIQMCGRVAYTRFHSSCSCLSTRPPADLRHISSPSRWTLVQARGQAVIAVVSMMQVCRVMAPVAVSRSTPLCTVRAVLWTRQTHSRRISWTTPGGY